MAILTNYNYKGVPVSNAYIRPDRIFGSSKEGWNSLIGVYNPITDSATGAVSANLNQKIDEFNLQAPFSSSERGYESIYNALTTKFGGTAC